MHYSSPLKLRKLLILRYATNAKIGQTAEVSYAAVTWGKSQSCWSFPVICPLNHRISLKHSKLQPQPENSGPNRSRSGASSVGRPDLQPICGVLGLGGDGYRV